MAVEKINFQISKTPQFTDWLEKPGNEIPDDIGIMLSDANQGASEESLEWLKLHVLVTLFCAEKYSHENDWFSKYTMNEHIENLESQLKHASRFNELIKEDPEFGVRFFVNACVPQNSPGKVLFSIPADQYKQIDGTTGIYSIFKTMFLDYKISLKREIDVLRKSKKNPMLIARGGLLCDKNLTKNIGFNSTLFHLAFHYPVFPTNR